MFALKELKAENTGKIEKSFCCQSHSNVGDAIGIRSQKE